VAERCIINLHIPKTGGVTLRKVLKLKYDPDVLFINSLSRSFDEISETTPISRLTATKVVSGHLHYGIHELIPRECAYITLLREPVARVLSMYYYILGDRRHWLHHELVDSGMGLEGFVRTAADPGVDNVQTRLVSGWDPGELLARGPKGRARRFKGKEPTRLPPEALDEATRNLERFLVVGLTERFDESFILIRRALDWRLPLYVTSNVSAEVKPASERAIELIRERNQLDLELYDFARTLFDAQVAEQGLSFRREVAAFRALKWIPDKIGPRAPTALRRRLQASLPR
jgi:Galactose-3-O-sulfotransferase